MLKAFSLIFCLIISYFGFAQTEKTHLLITSSGLEATIIYDSTDNEFINFLSEILASDMELVCNKKPKIACEIPENSSFPIIIGTTSSTIIKELEDQGLISLNHVKNKLEVFTHRFTKLPNSKKTALVICGSDNRGTAYGVFRLSEIIGISPWTWWADVPPTKCDSISIPAENYTSKEPSVKYRGIFLNDEDWGLQPWAAKTFEPEVGDIGPKTYSKIFELLLRLRANTIWPAMHNCTKSFFTFPGNVEMARKYNIVVGSSHAEPMLRNNVDEWDKESLGDFNYNTNRENVYRYWEQRVIESKNNEAVYTLGMRGIHDSGMEGYTDLNSKKNALANIISDQREILEKNVDTNILAIPQVFIAYKEVLDIYDYGLILPDDITMVWTDDNYGYIKRLNSIEEAKRKGGSGVYYHISYWGRPHDYLWLSTTHPLLIWEEMNKAYFTNSREIWIVNVGDIKPAEYNMQLFLDMAYNISDFQSAGDVKNHFTKWYANIFGGISKSIIPLFWDYYRLSFERRPEFMGWSQTEPSTKTHRTGYNHFYFGDEAQKRIDAWSEIEVKARLLSKEIPENVNDSYFQLIYYPLVCASLMNKKFLYADKAEYYSRFQNRFSAGDYQKLSQEAFDEIQFLTKQYNQQISDGKWKYIMYSAPRNLSVFGSPEIKIVKPRVSVAWNTTPEGYVSIDSCLFREPGTGLELPPFSFPDDEKKFIDIYLTQEKDIEWEAKTTRDWIKLSSNSGKLEPALYKSDARIWVSIDWGKLTEGQTYSGEILIKSGSETKKIKVVAEKSSVTESFNHTESSGIITIDADDYVDMNRSGQLSWNKIEGLGYSETMLQAPLIGSYPPFDSLLKAEDYPYVDYEFYSNADSFYSVQVYCLPTHPLNSENKLRLAVSLDGSPFQIIDFTTYGRSEEWKQNVLSNRASRLLEFNRLISGKHKLRIIALDPGICLDYIEVVFGKRIPHYSKSK